MQAVVFEGKEQMRVAQLPRPQCGPKDILLQVAACGVCGGDARSFFLSDAFTGTSRIPGHEPAGIVAEVGREVTAYQPGDRLALAADVRCGECFYCKRELFNMCDRLRIFGKHINGALADYMLLDEDLLAHGIINPVPKGLPLLHAALSEPLCSILASHDELEIRAGEYVLIIGAGPMGVMHHELLRARGARVALADTSTTRLGLARDRFGAERTFDANGDLESSVRGETEGAGADVVITAAPSGAAVQRALGLVRKRGRIGLFGGLPAGQAEVGLDINRIHYAELRLVGNFSYHPCYHQKALDLLASRRVDAGALITTYPLNETQRALHDIREGRVLKAVVVPNGGELL